MLIASTINSQSNKYSLINKEALDYYTQVAVADIEHPSINTSYIITHNLGTQNIVLNAYDVSTALTSVEISYTVPDNSTAIVSFGNFDSSVNTVRIVVTGAVNYTQATVTPVSNNNE